MSLYSANLFQYLVVYLKFKNVTFSGVRRRQRGRQRRGERGRATDALGAAGAADRALRDRAHPASAHVQLAQPAAPPHAPATHQPLRL